MLDIYANPNIQINNRHLFYGSDGGDELAQEIDPLGPEVRPSCLYSNGLGFNSKSSSSPCGRYVFEALTDCVIIFSPCVSGWLDRVENRCTFPGLKLWRWNCFSVGKTNTNTPSGKRTLFPKDNNNKCIRNLLLLTQCRFQCVWHHLPKSKA